MMWCMWGGVGGDGASTTFFLADLEIASQRQDALMCNPNASGTPNSHRNTSDGLQPQIQKHRGASRGCYLEKCVC